MVNTVQRRRLLALVGFLVFSVVLIGVGVLLGSRIRSPEELAALAEPPPPSPVLVDVERRTLTDTAVLRATVDQLEAEGIDLPVGGGGIVTSIDLDPGGVVQLGDLLVTVEGRPRIALEGDFPFYRDLARTDEGPDVAQLEENLVALGFLDEADDVFGRDTQRGVAALYHAVGYEPTGGAWWRAQVDMDELVVFSSLPVQVASTSFTVGDDLTEASSPHLALSPQEVVLVAEVDDQRVIGALTPGMTLAAVDEVEGRQYEVSVREVVPGAEGAKISFAPQGGAPDPNLERSLRIDVPIADSGGPVTAVPVTALFTGPDGSTFVSTPGGDVEVRVGLIVDGWAEVEPLGGSLEPGDLVSVSENDGS